MNNNLSNNINNKELQKLENDISTFDKMKFIDEDGVEKISGRELSKALGYTKWQNFKKAIERTNEQIKNNGKDEEQITEVSKLFDKGNGAKQTGSDYHLTRKQAINVANNCDTSKPEVAKVQEWLYDTSEIGERTINIYNKLKDREYIENRNQLSISNRQFSGTCLEHGVKSNELSKIHNACDESLYHMSTQEIKDKYGKSNRPKADYLGNTMCIAENYAKLLSSNEIDNQDAQGYDECKDIVTDIHDEIREQIKRRTGKNPEDHITGEYIGDTRKRYNKLTKDQLKAIEKEY